MPKYYPPFAASSGETLQSKFLYDEREYYKLQTKELFEEAKENYIDLWYETPFYGKVNPNGEFVYPMKKFIRSPMQIDAAGNPNLIGFDFALKALNEYLFFLTRGFAAGRTGLNLLLNNFKVVSSYVDPMAQYIDHVSKNMNIFNDYVIRTGKYSKIVDFETFTCELLDALESVNESLTFFHHFTSNKTNLSSTGLSFRFLDADQDDDYIKNKYFQHPEFSKYVSSAANFGFRINKNSPWEIIVDVNSKPMMSNRKIKRKTRSNLSQREVVVAGYLQEKLVRSPSDFFDKYYKKVMSNSFLNFEQVLISSYKQYSQRILYTVDYGRPYISFDKYSNVISGRDYERKLLDRRLKPLEVYSNKKYNRLFFLKKYERMLNIEFKNKFNKQQYVTFKNNFDRDINRSKSYGQALATLDKFYSNLTKIYDPQTKKLFWNSPKKPLTSELNNGMIQTKPQPTVSKVVTEFIPDI